MKYNYQVTLGSGQSCQTPCNLQVRPGATSILVAGPGQRQFQRTIVIPPQPVEIRVQDYSLARIILGSFFASWSLPLLGAGGAVLSDRGGELTGSIILTHGLIFLGLGAGLLGTIHTNRATVTPINMPRRKLEVVGSSLTPTADRTGVVGSVKVLF